MKIYYVIKGRLGNAIFRYMASVIFCIVYNAEYIPLQSVGIDCTDAFFLNLSANLLNNNKTSICSDVVMSSYYQHDLIYRKYMQEIKNFIRSHTDHYVLTDGIKAGDKRYEKFRTIDFISVPEHSRKYKTVLHIRLEDFVTHNLYIPADRIISLFNDNLIESDEICIVCGKLTTPFEIEYIESIKKFLESKNMRVIFESNDTLTDYHIMLTAETLICSKSTLSWCAALLSDSLQRCFVPDYNISSNQTFKKPIDNTILY